MRDIEVVIGLLAGVALLAAIADRAGLPHAAVLVLGGLVLGVVPGVPEVRLRSQLVLLGFLPPLVYSAAFRAAGYDLRRNALHILTLAIGLVLLTVGAVAAAGRAVAGVPWAAAFVLGALAAPTDPVSASAVMRDVGAPERIVAILEGESLINDGTGLAVLQVAVVAAGGGISIGSGVLRFVAISLGGCAIGLVVGWLSVHLRRRLDEPSLEIVLGLLAAYGSYVAAYAVGWSGVLSAVTAGLYIGRRAELISSAGARLNMEPFWNALSFVLESVLFLLIGLQLRLTVSGLPSGDLVGAIGDGVVVVLAALAVRAAWMAALGLIPLLLRRDRPPLPARELVVLGLSGMRGALSLAGALSIPLVISHHAFPARNQVVFLAYIVVIGTLVLPSLTLKTVVRRLGLARSEALRRQELEARSRVAHAGLARLEELGPDAGVPEETLDRLRAVLELRLERLEAMGGRDGAEAGERAPDSGSALRRLRRAVIDAERQALAEMRRQRRAPTQVLARIQHDIDLDETRLH